MPVHAGSPTHNKSEPLSDLPDAGPFLGEVVRCVELVGHGF